MIKGYKVQELEECCSKCEHRKRWTCTFNLKDAIKEAIGNILIFDTLSIKDQEYCALWVKEHRSDDNGTCPNYKAKLDKPD